MTGRIAFQGEPGANSHIACHEVHPDYALTPCATFEDVFAVVTSGDADLAMIPVENSIAGRVAASSCLTASVWILSVDTLTVGS